MSLPIKTKVSIFVTAIIIFIGGISAALFVSAHSRALEGDLTARGIALSQSLAKAAEEGLAKEDLDLIKNASHIVQAKDVIRADVYTNLWDIVESHSSEEAYEPPHPQAVEHFKNSDEPFYIKTKDGGAYNFYGSIKFQPPLETPPITIGFVKVCLSAWELQKGLKKTIAKNIFVSGFITFLSIITLHMLISRLVTTPLARLHKSISAFKYGALPDALPVESRDEIGELSEEFNRMARTIKEKERMLVESEKRIRSLFDRTEHIIFRLDKDFRIIESNRKFNEVFGDADNLCNILIQHDVHDCMRMAASGGIAHSEKKAVDKNGSDLSVLLSMYPENERDGSIKGFDGYMIDITETRLLEEQLAQSRRMEAIGTLAGGIAHDFNNLLQGIIGYTSLLKLKLPETDPSYKPIDTIEHSAQRAAELTRQILGFARGGKYVLKPVNLNTAVRHVLQIVTKTFDKAIEIRQTLQDGLWTIEADQGQIEHVLLNICINARDAIADGGIIKIETLNKNIEEAGLLSEDAAPGRYAIVKISDTGAGMDVRTKSRIFEPFFTTKEKGKGTGMGLAMAYGVIKNHGGFITVESEPGKGSSFSVYLPATEKQPETETADVKEIPTGKGTILIVDDEDFVREAGRSILRQCGYEVIEAADGLEAIKIYNEKKDSIDMVILDIIMPRMGGKAAFEKIKEINPDVKVLISSGYSIDGAAKEILDAGAKDFMQKPYNFKELTNRIKNILTQ
jgi:PAS domain S-box-containing protein